MSYSALSKEHQTVKVTLRNPTVKLTFSLLRSTTRKC